MTLSVSDEHRLQRAWNCRLTTRGRKSGQPRRVTIWYAYEEGVVYLTGGSADPHWCRNIRACPDVELEIGGLTLSGRAEVVDDDGAADDIRQRFAKRYFAARIARMLGTGYTDSTAVRVVLDLSSA